DHVGKLQPVETAALHPDVEDHGTGPAPGDFVRRGIGVVRLAGLVALVLDDAGDQVADVVLIVNDQYVECHYSLIAACNCGSSSFDSGCAPSAFVSASPFSAAGVADSFDASLSCSGLLSGRSKAKH